MPLTHRPFRHFRVTDSQIPNSIARFTPTLTSMAGFWPMLILLGLSMTPAYAEWELASGDDSAKLTVYVDRDTIQRKGNLAKMWQLYATRPCKLWRATHCSLSSGIMSTTVPENVHICSRTLGFQAIWDVEGSYTKPRRSSPGHRLCLGASIKLCGKWLVVSSNSVWKVSVARIRIEETHSSK